MPITPTPGIPPQGTVLPTVRLLAGTLRQALIPENGGFRLARVLPDGRQADAGLAAVRVLGADVLTPFVVNGLTLTAQDAALIRTAVRAYPAPQAPASEVSLWGVRDAALVRALAASGVDATGWEGLAPAESPARLLTLPWVAMAAELVRMTGAAPPFAEQDVRAHLARRHLDVGRGLVRALLRRDLLSAARLARWLGPADARLTAPVLDYLEIAGTDDARVTLETAITRRLMTGASPEA
ncbi:hypothetical protein [Nonomuraea longicatena]|uniref:Uncharacterized protein n=1 Tax=Nonomuraea longicatena TaxID=83682 RepID=A0ABN1NWU2_9ACTN